MVWIQTILLFGQLPDEAIERLVEETASSIEYNLGIDKLRHYSTYPFSINTASKEDLIESSLFSSKQINVLLLHRKKYGALLSANELISLPFFNKRHIAFLSPLITTEKSKNQKTIHYPSSLLLYRIRIADTKTMKFRGDNTSQLFRYRYQLGNKVSTGFTLDKDIGEPLVNQLSSPLDFTSFHIGLKTNSFIKKINLGDYKVRFGQGLAYWNGIGFGKSALTTEVKKSDGELSSYTSANEFNFLRGAAIEMGTSNFRYSSFYSSKKRDASLSDEGDYSWIQTSGLHRTKSELENKNRVNEEVIGNRITFQNNRFKLGLTNTHISYNHHLEREGIENQFNFKGKKLSTTSFDFDYIGKELNIYGEGAITSPKKQAFIVGVDFTPSPLLQFSQSVRKFSAGYFTPYVNGFGEQSSTSNEQGIYTAISVELIPKIVLNAYHDIYKLPWASFTTSSPSKGNDILAQLHYTISDQLAMYGRFKYEKKERTTSDFEKVNELISTTIQRARYHISYTPFWYVRLQSRIELSHWQKKDVQETGFLIYQDIQYKFPSLRTKQVSHPLAITGRIAFFDTPSFATRIYAYENDVLYAFSVPAYYGSGIRTMVMAKYSLTKSLALWARYSNSSFKREKTLGKQQDVKFQLIASF
ncbi:MAG: hypothetical protein AB8B61_09310 [Cyclobacteriaceae bacterium]